MSTFHAWDRSVSEKGDNDLSFPEQADIDKDGIVYYIMKEGKYSLKEPVDEKEYNVLRKTVSFYYTVHQT